MKERRNINIVLEDLNMEWTSKEIEDYISLWLRGDGIFEIANFLNRDPDELLLLIIDFQITFTGYNFFLRRQNGLGASPPISMNWHLTRTVKKFLSTYKNGYSVLSNATKINFFWSNSEFSLFKTLWDNGASVQTMAKTFKRNEWDIVLLILDRARNDYITPRKNGLEGWGEDEVKKTSGKRNRNKSKVS